MNRRGVALAVGGLLALQVAAYAVFRAVEAGRRDPFELAAEPLEGPAPGLDVALERREGSPLRLRELAGAPVLVHFWATWCEPCAEEIPALVSLAAEARGEIEVVLVSVDATWGTVAHFFRGEVPTWVVRDGSEALRAAYEVGALPVSYLLRPDGTLAARVRGPRAWGADRALGALRALAQ